MRHLTLSPHQKEVLKALSVRPIQLEEGPRWISLMRKHHYLGLKALVGKSMGYVAEYQGQWLALLGWSAAALECTARDNWIGWAPVLKWQRISYVANNSRFLILPETRIPNLASRVLALNLKRLAEDWETAHGHQVVVAETFVDPSLFRGSCYKGGGWLELGMTSGWGRSGKKYYRHGNPKMVLVRQLAERGRQLLADPQPHEIFKEVKPMKLTVAHAGSLLDALRGLPDPRQRRGIRHRYKNILAMAICAVMSGAKSFTAIGEWAAATNQNMRRRLGCRKDKVGRYIAPSEPTLRRALQESQPDQIDEVLGGWLCLLNKERAEGIAIDGKTLKGARQDSGRQVHLISAFMHRQGVVVAQKQVEEKANEITEVIPLLEPLDLEGQVITADAMHTQKNW